MSKHNRRRSEQSKQHGSVASANGVGGPGGALVQERALLRYPSKKLILKSIKRLQLDSNLEPLSSYTNTQPFGQTGSSPVAVT